MLTNYKKTAIGIFYCYLILWGSFLVAASLSGATYYPTFCQQAADNDETFAHFKRSPTYQGIVETVSRESGGEYLYVILRKEPSLVTLFDKFRENDAVGDPVIYNYGRFGWFSPTNLRYIKTACDLKQQFRDLSQMHIVEIGGGYGGLCKILNDLKGFATYTIIDLPECNALARKYLSLMGVKNVHFVDNKNLSNLGSYDLVISNYAFSEIDREEQQGYIDYVIKCTPNGYMTMNFISQHLRSIPLEELLQILYQNKKQGSVVKEYPLTHPDNRILTWKSI